MRNSNDLQTVLSNARTKEGENNVNLRSSEEIS
jgi:hypothetical protein